MQLQIRQPVREPIVVAMRVEMFVADPGVAASGDPGDELAQVELFAQARGEFVEAACCGRGGCSKQWY